MCNKTDRFRDNYIENKSPAWDMSQERALNDTLLSQRFNFFIVFFSLIVTASVKIENQLQLQLLYGIGFVICLILYFSIRRTHIKLRIILRILEKDPSHPFTIIKNEANDTHNIIWGFEIGVLLPIICCTIVFICFILSISNILTVELLNN